MERCSIGQFTQEINVTVQTLRNWNHTGNINHDYISLYRCHYSCKQLDFVRLYLHKELRER